MPPTKISNASVAQHPHNTTQLQNQSKTPHAFIYYTKIIKNHLKSSNITQTSKIHILIHKTAKPQGPTDPTNLAGKTNRPPPNTKKAITKAISIFSTQTLHQSIKLN